jgi:L-aspartate oxidase
MRQIDPARFPNVFSALREAGLDPAKTLVPVAPAAHYTIGGVRTDLHGRSSVPGLYAIGETSCTGIHGANRLASNSLSECFVFGARAAAAALAEPEPPALETLDADAIRGTLDGAAITAPSRETREAVWEHAGLTRTRESLEALLADSHQLAALIARFALSREESRGVHERADFPKADPALVHRHLVIGERDEPSWQEWR